MARAITPEAFHDLSDTTGFDGCQYNSATGKSDRQPSVTEMQKFYQATPYYDFYVYLGGTNGRALCGPGGVGASWIDQVTNIGFSLLPIWVGRSGNCSNTSTKRVSCTPTVAYQQGFDEAQLAWQVWLAAGFSGNNVAPSLDIEAFTNTSQNRAAVKAYVNGWVAWFHVPPAQIASAYGSSCGSFPKDWASITNVPDAVWFAQYASTINPATQNDVWDVTCVSNGYWAFDQRYHQWWNTHKETRNGVTLSIDVDCADSNVSPYGRFDPGTSGSSYPIACNTYF